jgi:hypothetical protein
MRVRTPDIEFVPRALRYAPRPASLAGLRIGFVDGWGEALADGTTGMYPTMVHYEQLLRDQYGIGPKLWLHKESVSRPLTEVELDGISKEVDVVINGEGL